MIAYLQGSFDSNKGNLFNQLNIKKNKMFNSPQHRMENIGNYKPV